MVTHLAIFSVNSSALEVVSCAGITQTLSKPERNRAISRRGRKQVETGMADGKGKEKRRKVKVKKETNPSDSPSVSRSLCVSSVEAAGRGLPS